MVHAKSGRVGDDGAGLAVVPSYTPTEAAALLGLPLATLRSWAFGRPYRVHGARRLFKPVIELDGRAERLLSFRNLVELHVLAAIRRVHHVQLPAVRTALRYLGESLNIDHPLAHAQMQTDGTSLLVERYGKLINATGAGQLEMKSIVARFLRRVEHDERGLPIRLYPMFRLEADDSIAPIVVDPRIQFGRPCIAERGIPTTVVASRFLAGESVEALARDYSVDIPDIEEALRFEQKLVA